MTQPAPPSGRLALVAEDDPIILMETVDTLADAGFHVLEAYNAAQAMAQLEAHPGVVLLVTDVQMPGPIQGFELARLVHGRWPSIPVLVCSGHVAPREGELPPTARFLSKPLCADGLGKALIAFGLA